MQFSLDWGVYKVDVVVENSGDYTVYYADNRGNAPQGAVYRKLSTPERQAVVSEINRRKGIKMDATQEILAEREKRFRSDLRDAFARDYAKVSLERPGNKKHIAKNAYAFADEMLAARDEASKCAACGKEK